MLKLNTVIPAFYISNHGYTQRPHLLYCGKENAVTSEGDLSAVSWDLCALSSFQSKSLSGCQV